MEEMKNKMLEMDETELMLYLRKKFIIEAIEKKPLD